MFWAKVTDSWLRIVLRTQSALDWFHNLPDWVMLTGGFVFILLVALMTALLWPQPSTFLAQHPIQ
ncbi:MAG TPA: hypothetical protein VFK07_01560 [Candidatus Paceibacterota bacterium]|nr:hypothetical protein [Candidatus Paceibacterota bacterium]